MFNGKLQKLAILITQGLHITSVVNVLILSF